MVFVPLRGKGFRTLIQRIQGQNYFKVFVP